MEFENEIFSGAPPRELPPRLCDVPHCGKMCVPTHSFDHTNVTCWECDKFHCIDCTKQIWSGEWNGEIFYKPVFKLPGMRHEVFRCAFCRASFDRFKEVAAQEAELA